MSEVVHYTGTLSLVAKFYNNDIEQVCKHILKSKKVKIDPGYESAKEQLMDYFSDEYVIIKDKIFKINQQENIENNFVFEMYPMSIPDQLKFNVKYYDGACSFQEALERAYENMEGE